MDMEKVLKEKRFETKELAKKFVDENQILNTRVRYDKNTKNWRIVKVPHITSKYENFEKRVLTTMLQKDFISIAKELCYPNSVISAIKNTNDVDKMSRIMTDARHGIFPKEDEDESSRVDRY